MINAITARNRVLIRNVPAEVNRELTFDLNDSEIVIKGIDGLGPVKATVNTVDIPEEPGGAFLSAQDGMRNIVLRLGYNPDYLAGSTVGALRRKLYQVFMPKMQVELVFHTDDLGDLTIVGNVESCEPVIFTQDPEIQVSIICTFPYFRGPAGFTTVDFPSTNGITYFNFFFEGDVPVGYRLEWVDAGGVTEPYFQSYTPDAFNRFSIFYDFQTGDKVNFSSIKGERGIMMRRSGQDINLLEFFSGSIVAMRLVPGWNYFALNGFYNANLKMSYETLIGGI